ncbi:MAG: hypothetical protein NC037_05030 [Bacteroides sp.]|nr:hypothetical protein [Bacillota bacterium]MCM1455869.1 hypothetical protein [Bacteroides sp.]
MKKLWLILVGVIVANLVLLTSCVYIGLPAEKVKRHNEAIKQQLPDFSLDNFSGSFYYIPESEGKSIYFSSKNGKREYLIKTNEKLSYFDGITEKTYTFSTKVEENTSENTADYQSIENDIQNILDLVHSYNGTYDKITSISGSQKCGEEVYDEIEHDVYSMEWKYSSIALFLFYINTETSVLHSIYLRDISENMNEEKPHFDLFIYSNESFVSSLKYEYETLKSVS